VEMKTSGQTLKDWQDAQLDKLSDEPDESQQTTVQDVPNPNADLTEILDFCLSLQGYADGQKTIEDCFEIARKVEAEGFAKADLESLSVAAFIWQRAFVWGAPHEQSMYERKMRAAVEEIQKRSSQQ